MQFVGVMQTRSRLARVHEFIAVWEFFHFACELNACLG